MLDTRNASENCFVPTPFWKQDRNQQKSNFEKAGNSSARPCGIVARIRLSKLRNVTWDIEVYAVEVTIAEVDDPKR